MSIQRYDILHPKMRDKGRFVLYADHIADKDAELHNILSPLADIRAALGVGEKPMLSELAGIVQTRMGVIKILERDAKENAAEVERLTAARDAAVRERDAARKSLVACQLDNGTAELIVSRDFVAEVRRIKQTAARIVRERNAAVEALRHCRAEIAYFQRLAHGKQEFPPTNGMEMADAALAKIEGGRG